MKIQFKKWLAKTLPDSKIRQPISIRNIGSDDITITLAVPERSEDRTGLDIKEHQLNQRMEVATYSTVGTRASQQDSVRFCMNEQRVVSVVCDGMGGLEGGERASALSAEGMLSALIDAPVVDIPQTMGLTAGRLNEQIRDLRNDQNQKIEAGTTLTAIVVDNNQLFWCSVGDSHIYLYRAGVLKQLNEDHILRVQLDRLVREGMMTQSEAKQYPNQQALTSYLGMPLLNELNGNQVPVFLQSQDMIMQCTDGLYRCLKDREIIQILNSAEDERLDQTVQELVRTAIYMPGSHDNTSVSIIRIRE